MDSWLWPDKRIGKRESRKLREEHNAVVNLNAELVDIASEAITTLEAWQVDWDALANDPNYTATFTTHTIVLRTRLDKAKARGES